MKEIIARYRELTSAPCGLLHDEAVNILVSEFEQPPYYIESIVLCA